MSNIIIPGTITAIVGPMFGGKTDTLTTRIKREIIAKRNYIVFNSAQDDRFGTGNQICTHDKIKYPAHKVHTTSQMQSIFEEERKRNNLHTTFIDEYMFFDSDILNFTEYVAREGINVTCFGLDMTSEGKPFPFKDGKKDIGSLLAMADHIIKLKAVCMHCGGEASRTHSLVPKIEDVAIGEKDKYTALCKPCWYKANVYSK
jgi:thymidine kinase